MGICFVDSYVVLVSPDRLWWTLPGGKPERDETAVQALRREVREEACAIVHEAVYLGSQRVDDLDHPDGPRRYYQTRFWAAVELLPFTPAFETIARRLVAPSELIATLFWGGAPVVPVLMDLAIACEETRRDSHR
jgi:ADP-ribose pyrophosphatase YjhB (NUDIX family)